MVIGYNLSLWQEYKIKQDIDVPLHSHPSLLLTGASGSGKSYALKYLLGKLLSIHDADLTFCNFKQSEDFRFLEEYGEYFSYTDCAGGLQGFYDSFKRTQTLSAEFYGTFRILVFDEFPAFILSETMKDKKTAEQYKLMISELLMLGRSYGYGVWLVMQRPDSAFFANGARDNFHMTVSLGNLSKEAKAMLYSGEDLPKDHIYQTGEGIAWIDGQGILQIKYPRIRDLRKLETKILDCLRRRAQRAGSGAGRNPFT